MKPNLLTRLEALGLTGNGGRLFLKTLSEAGLSELPDSFVDCLNSWSGTGLAAAGMHQLSVVANEALARTRELEAKEIIASDHLVLGEPDGGLIVLDRGSGAVHWVGLHNAALLSGTSVPEDATTWDSFESFLGYLVGEEEDFLEDG